MGSVFESSTRRWRRASCWNRSSPRMGSRSRALFHAAQNCSNVCVDFRRRARCLCHSRGSIRPSCHSRHRGSVSIVVQTRSGERLAPPPSVVRARFRLTLTITRPMSKMIALTALQDSGACGLVRESSATASLGRLPRLVGAGKERWSLSEASGTSRAARRRWPVVARGRRPQR